MAKKLVVVTSPEIVENGFVSFRFIFDSGAPRNVVDAQKFGFVKREPKGSNELDPWRLARSEPNAVGPDGKEMWRLWEFEVGGGSANLAASVEESGPDEPGLQGVISELSDCVLLMSRHLFENFESACRAIGVEVVAHHYEGHLVTS